MNFQRVEVQKKRSIRYLKKVGHPPYKKSLVFAGSKASLPGNAINSGKKWKKHETKLSPTYD